MTKKGNTKQFTVKIIDKDGAVKSEINGTKEVHLCFEEAYQEGDEIWIYCSEYPAFVWLQLDDAIGKSLVYLTGEMNYIIPFGEKRANVSPKSFMGNKHLLSAKQAQEFEITSYRNLAFNVWDQHQHTNCFPHATANVETRGESVFAAQNAIDGVTINTSHGEWPYESWGINMQDDAAIRIDFGREVSVNHILLYTRADFPHDNWWKEISFRFSDGTSLDKELDKNHKPHYIDFPEKRISYLEMYNMKKADDPSPFPALTQIEVYGMA